MMAATRKDRGNSCHRGQAAHRWMMTALRSLPSWSRQLFQAEPASGGGWLFCRLLTGGLTLSAAKLRTWENISLPTLAPTFKRSSSWSGRRRLWFFFFFVRTTIVASLDGQQDVQCSKVRLLAGRSWPTTCKGPECLLRTSAVNSFLVQRICLHSDTHRQSHWKGSYDHTAESFSQSPMLSATRSSKQASEGAQNQTPE